MFTYQGKKMKTMGDVCDAFEKASDISFIEGYKFIQEYDIYSAGVGTRNLNFHFGNPYFYAYKKHHPKFFELSEHIMKTKELESEISRDFNAWTKKERLSDSLGLSN